MTTPSSDDARTRRDDPADERSAVGAPDGGRTGRRAGWDDTSDLETTAVRRQGFLGVRDDAGTRTDGDAATVADAHATAGAHDARTSPAVPAAAPTSAPTRSATSPEDAALRDRWRERPEPAGDALLDGATQATPRSRAAAHWWGLLLTLVLSPVAWYLVADAGARLTLGESSPWDRGELNPAAVVELAAGFVVTAVVLLTARRSSLGALVTGTLVLLAGLTFVVIPAETASFLEPATTWLWNLNALGGNVAHHLMVDGPSGRLALYGLGLLLTGLVARGARRRGRAEERTREAYARSTGRSARHGNGRS